jgi:hypothetical protein
LQTVTNNPVHCCKQSCKLLKNLHTSKPPLYAITQSCTLDQSSMCFLSCHHQPENASISTLLNIVAVNLNPAHVDKTMLTATIKPVHCNNQLVTLSSTILCTVTINLVHIFVINPQQCHTQHSTVYCHN